MTRPPFVEYKILETASPTASEEQLNEFGMNGWLLTTIVQWNGKTYYYFSRPKQRN